MEANSAAMDGTRDASPRTTKALNVLLLMGGPSAEREVSLQSGAAVFEALRKGGHKVTGADITPSDPSALDAPGIDVVFIALHGAFGESGEVQALCEARRLPYVGSGIRASQLSMDKAATKQIVKRAGVATPDWMIIESFHTPRQVAGWLAELPVPVVLKPVDGGSSVDITIARSESARDLALEDLLDRHGRAMIERYVPGRELTVGILGQEPLPVLEIVPDRDFYDYTAKYSDAAATRYLFDHGLPEELTRAVQADALKAHRAMECRDLSRVDFLLDGEGRHWFLEINTIPGFTSHSLLPKAAAEAGIDFVTLCDRLLAMAMNR